MSLKLQINCNIDDAYHAHGFGVLMNKAISIIAKHQDNHGNYDVAIDEPQINTFFKHVKQRHQDKFEIKSNKDLITESKIRDQAHRPHNIHKLKKQFDAFTGVFQIAFTKVNSHKFGIHLRGTDKATEIASPDMNVVYHHIDEWLKQHDDNYVFLATDDNKYLLDLLERYPNKIKCNQSHIRSNDGKPIHFDKELRPRLNFELFTEIGQLASSAQIGYCYSNVSYLALTIGIHNFKNIINLHEAI